MIKKISFVLLTLVLVSCKKNIDHSKIFKATYTQVTNINSGLLDEFKCSPVVNVFTQKLEGENGYIVSAKIYCPGINGDIATWYTSSKDDSMMILSLNSTSRSFSIWPKKYDSDFRKEKLNLERFLKLQKKLK